MRTRTVFPTVVATTLISARLSYGQECGVPAVPAAPIDATLYTKYILDGAHTGVGWVVCSSLPGSSGCYGSGEPGPVMVSSKLKNTRGIVTRNLLGLPFLES